MEEEKDVSESCDAVCIVVCEKVCLQPAISSYAEVGGAT